MNSKDYIKLEDKYGANNYKPLDVVISRGEGVWVWDTEGNKYMDFLAAYSAVNQGHCHKKIISAAKEQIDQLTLTSRAFRNDKLGLFYEKICTMTGFEKCLPMNSGAEAVETAIKLARKWGYKKKQVEDNGAEIIVADGNFHGRTTTIVGFSSEEQYKDGFGPFTPGFKIVRFGDVEDLKKAINKNTVGILLEPAQGEGGIIFPGSGYLREVRKICDEENIMFMLDEIQSGLGRTGKLFCYEHDNIRPDALIVGKALSGGVYPVSAVLADGKYMNVFNPGDHGSTYGGNPVAAVVGLAALEVIEEENLVENSRVLGEYMMEELRKIDSAKIKEIRGQGLWIGVELNNDAGGARIYCEELMKLGLLCKETHEHVIRIAPPLVITREEIDWALNKIKKVL
ncbi:MAG: ornithine--oxo-acid transaminase [Candidatus Magasanikbacteria bacterium]|jgi:ornithine--oxo-acid transaminase|nr:ornithine--oxo-acid transaminase [Candidatus Magasanikbacteria bacterium]MBT4314935.1 ornithine--oxo-acid transaminase [Candidatus Magasanikbacteria bacterium]MBT4546891.1 ornithine--oxo-acid transaminase [Candidatus Magasanikbacteria bacterium]MBT6819195.1 ornithine--oxo-acid transaminase [Candidatus Magasanikbacteria bacterium]